MFFNRLDNPSDAATGLPVELFTFCWTGFEFPPAAFHKSYSTLEAKKSPECRTDTNEDFCLEPS
jgi:hypothetical protein